MEFPQNRQICLVTVSNSGRNSSCVARDLFRKARTWDFIWNVPRGKVFSLHLLWSGFYFMFSSSSILCRETCCNQSLLWSRSSHVNLSLGFPIYNLGNIVSPSKADVRLESRAYRGLTCVSRCPLREGSIGLHVPGSVSAPFSVPAQWGNFCSVCWIVDRAFLRLEEISRRSSFPLLSPETQGQLLIFDFF